MTDETDSKAPLGNESFLIALEEVRKVCSDQELGDGLGVSRSTFNRWTQGKNLPHPVMRKKILSYFKAMKHQAEK